MLKNIKSLFLLITIFLFVQAFFNFASYYLGVGRTLVNVDYIFVLLISLVGFRLVSYVTMLFFLLVDIFMLVVQVLPFTRATEFLYFMTRLEHISSQYIFTLLIILVLFLFFSIIFIHVVSKAEKLHKLILFNIFIFAFYILGHINDTANTDNRFYRVASVPAVDSAFLYAYNYRTTGFVSASRLKDQKFQKSSDERSFCDNIGCDRFDNDKKILFILNESWGEYRNSYINTSILKNIFNNYKVNKSYSIFSGVTVAAELKELCGLSTNSFYLKNASSEALSDCFPNKISNPNSKIISYHGAGSSMYDRYYWYGKAGFNESYFYDNYPWKKRCYSFPGACDEEISKKIVLDIKEAKSGFFYWLTLNTHHNYNLKDLQRDTPSCDELGIRNNEICRNAKLQYQFFLILEDMLSELKDEKLIVYVLGDHAPQVSNMEDKEKYFHLGKVPWIKIDLSK